LNEDGIANPDDDHSVEIGDRPIFAPLEQVISDNCKEMQQNVVASPRLNVAFYVFATTSVLFFFHSLFT